MVIEPHSGRTHPILSYSCYPYCSNFTDNVGLVHCDIMSESRKDADQLPDTVSEFDVSEISAWLRHIDVHGIITSVSPIEASRIGKRCYFGKINDGKKIVNFSCFNPNLEPALEMHCDKGTPVKLCNIETMDLGNNNVSILINPTSSVQGSERYFELANKTTALLQNVTTGCIVLVHVDEVGEEHEVTLNTGYKEKRQSVMISDDSGRYEVTLWGEKCNMLHESRAYRITDVYKKEDGYFGITSYSQIDEIEENLKGFQIAAVTTHITEMCKYCDCEALNMDKNAIYACRSCKRSYPRKNLKRKVGASVELEKETFGKIVCKRCVFSARRIQRILQCTEQQLLDKTEADITEYLLNNSQLND